MSLNPDQPKSLSPPTGPPPFGESSDSASLSKSAPRRLHSGSFSSDFTFPSDDSSKRLSAHLPRNRRSHSSSTFQSGLGRIDSVHGDSDASGTAREKVSSIQEAEGAESVSLSARRSNKSSGSSSVDLGKMGRQSRHPHALGRRSASLDHGERIPIIHAASSSMTQPPPPLPTNRSRPVVYDDLDAAPTPTIPGGPRKDRPSPYSAQAHHKAPYISEETARRPQEASQSGKRKAMYMGGMRRCH